MYRSPNIVRAIKSRRLRWAGHVARMEEGRSAFKILKGKPTGKRPLGRPRRRWEDNIRMNLEEIGINAGNWVDSAQDLYYWRAIVNMALNLLVSEVVKLIIQYLLDHYSVCTSFFYVSKDLSENISINFIFGFYLKYFSSIYFIQIS